MARTDLTSAFTAAMLANGKSPRQLAIFHFPVAGDVYLSDQPLGAADGLTAEYLPLIEDWGTLIDMAGGDSKDHKAGEIRQISLTLWNGGTNPFSDYFLSENPENILVDLYQWETSLAESDAALIDTFVIQDPIIFDESNFLLTLDLVSVAMRFDNPLGDILTVSDWPNAKTDDIGKSIDIIVGTPGAVPTLAARIPARATLNGSILSNTMSIAANENLDDLNFPAAGTIQIETEFARYDSRTSTTFNIIQRGYLSTKAEHISQKEIIEVIANHTYLIGKGPISSVENIKVGGFPNQAAVTVDVDSNPACLIFSEAPFSNRFADTPTFLNMRFDSINGDNTAIQPYLAFDAEDAGTASLTSESNPKLSIRQTTINENVGEIVKVFLIVEHYESSNKLLNDLATVTVSGVGQVGTLSRPAPSEIVEITAEVDIDHGHNHDISNEHTHPFTDPALNTSDPLHGHGFTGSSEITLYPFGAIPVTYIGPKYFAFENCPLVYDSFVITISISLTGFSPYALVSGKRIGNGTSTIQLGAGESGGTKIVSVIGYDDLGGYSGITIYSMSAKIISDSTVVANLSGVNTNITVPGSNADIGANNIDDVESLSTDNAQLQVIDANQATRTIANTFDLTNHVNFSWDWFTNRDVSIDYTGNLDSQKIYIANVFFDIEYRKKEIVFSDDITCEPTGIIDDGSGTYTGTPGALITRPDHLRKFILNNIGSLPLSYIDNSSFAAAGTVYDSLAYAFNGILDANATVRETEKKMAFQCRSRFFWNAGQAKIKLREKLLDLNIDLAMTTDDFRLKSFSAERQPVSEINNKISIGYSKDWAATSNHLSAFKLFTDGQNNESIANNGTRENRDGFLFDLVTNQIMADDLKDFYLENLSEASTFYTFETYLEHFNLEKEDVLSLTTNFGNLKKARAVIRSINRVFGNGKLNKINLLRIVAEVVRYIRLQKSLSDTFSISDNIAFDLGFDLDFSEIITLFDDITLVEGREIADEITVSDLITAVMLWNISETESINISESTVFNLNIGLNDSVIMFESLSVNVINGFGVGGFGFIYGGQPYITSNQGDSLGASDLLSVAISSLLGDTITIEDFITFPAGFGGNDLSSGFGITRFGD